MMDCQWYDTTYAGIRLGFFFLSVIYLFFTENFSFMWDGEEWGNRRNKIFSVSPPVNIKIDASKHKIAVVLENRCTDYLLKMIFRVFG